MNQPYKCPVCKGKGGMPSGFYGTAPGAETCRTCSGAGIVWERHSQPDTNKEDWIMSSGMNRGDWKTNYPTIYKNIEWIWTAW